MDSNRQWCPHPNWELWVKGSKKNPKVMCDKGHKFWFIWQQDWHKGNCKDALDSHFLDWVAEKGISRWPKCNVRTEKKEGWNHMICIWGYQWWWLCKSKYSDYHYKHWNVFGWATMQYTIGWNKCLILLYYLAMILFLFPIFMLFCPLIYMVYGMYHPLETFNNWFASWWLIPNWMARERYFLSKAQKWWLSWWYLPFVIIFGLIFGLVFFAIFYGFAVVYTVYKMLRLMLRDWRWFKTMKFQNEN